MAYSDYADKTRSQKLILAQLSAREKLKLFDLYSGSIYRRIVNYFVTSVKVNGDYLVEASSNILSPGEFYYNPVEGYLYVRLIDDTDPKLNSIYASYRFFFSNLSADIPSNIVSGDIVHYDARIKGIGQLKLELDFENTGISLETNSSIQLENNDGYFDNIFDTLIWENNSAKFWSWSRDLPYSEAKLIYRGIITDKSFSSKEVKFNLKDELSKLRQSVSVGLFSELDGDLDSSMINKPKRIVFGRCDKLRTVGINKTLDGFKLTGSISGSADLNLIPGTVSGLASTNAINGTGTNFLTSVNPGDSIKITHVFSEYTYTVATVISNTQLTITGLLTASFSLATMRNNEVENNLLTGTGTSFLSEVSPGDSISVTVDQVEYSYGVAEVVDDTNIVLDDEIEASFIGVDGFNSPEIPYRGRNRLWHIAGHKLREYNLTISSVIDPTNINLVAINDLEVGDYLLINGYKYIVVRISGTNVRLNQALRSAVSGGDYATKIPVRIAYSDKQEYVIDRDFSVLNTSSDAILEFNDLAEFNVATPKNPTITFSFTSGSRDVSTVANDKDLTSILRPRDWIRAKSIGLPTWYEILKVNQDSLVLRTPASDNYTGNIQYKNPSYISDDTLVTVDTLGLEDGDSWIRYPAGAVKWLLDNVNLTDINLDSFAEALDSCQYTLSMVYPRSIGNAIPSIRDIIKDINESVFGSLYLDSNFQYSYKILNADRPEELTVVKDEDIIGFSVSTKSDIYNSVALSYAPYTDLDSQDDAFKSIIIESDFVNEAVEKVEQLKAVSYLYWESEATTIAERKLFFNSGTKSVVSVSAKLNFILNSLNDVISLDLSRLYKRYGSAVKRKMGLINSIVKDGSSTNIQINDLGNIFSRVPSIAPNDAPDYAPGIEEVDSYGYILDNDTETPDASSELELGSNLIG
jgi:hypothetical protein